jgi:hypothetical protein
VVKASFPSLSASGRRTADGEAAKTLNAALALFEIDRARAQVPMPETVTPAMEIETFLAN